MLVKRRKFVNASFRKEVCHASQSASSLVFLSMLGEVVVLIYWVNVWRLWWPPVCLPWSLKSVPAVRWHAPALRSGDRPCRFFRPGSLPDHRVLRAGREAAAPHGGWPSTRHRYPPLLGISNCSCTRFIPSRAMRLRSSAPLSDPFIISMNWGVRMYSSQVSASTFSIPPRILRISSEGGEAGEN